MEWRFYFNSQNPTIESERSSGADARATVPDQQMRPGPRYPVDRYLVESSNKIEMVNIIDDDIWNPEPALRPEEEIILRKLHEMLQSTADDLKLLSGELAQNREPRVQARTAPAPLDDEFNEKVHIQEVVNAKFHGHTIVDKIPIKTEFKIYKPQTNVLNTGVQTNTLPANKKRTVNKRLTRSRTNIVQINPTQNTNTDKVQDLKKTIKETVAYNEFTFQYPKPNEESPIKGLQVQLMPSINIRGELKEQKVLHLDIVPDYDNSVDKLEDKINVAVIAMRHDEPPITVPSMKIHKDYPQIRIASKQPARKVSKMVTCESSSSTNNISSDPQYNIAPQIRKRASTKKSTQLDTNKIKNNVTIKSEPPKRTHCNLEEWKKKLNSIYGHPSSAKKIPLKSKGNGKRHSPKRTHIPTSQISKPTLKPLNNTQYIPYSQLTLGGISVSDIEREISNIPNKSNIPLSPILDKIISSQENSCHNSPRKSTHNSKILTTSDENLLQEVIDIEKTVSKTLSRNAKIKVEEPQMSVSDSTNDDTNGPDSYVDDFEDDKSDKSEKLSLAEELNESTEHKNKTEITDVNNEGHVLESTKDETNMNTTYSKLPNLTLKNHVDVFEYVHAIDTQDEATQSQATNKISLKETQTSPRNGTSNMSVQPIHNDLRPSTDPIKKVEKMFKLEKDLIKKLIIDEYGDLIQNSIDKPSTSKENQESSRNVAASQKLTQTSPKRVKSVMTSPTKTKTRTTSPFLQHLTVDHKSSPIIFVVDEKEVKVEAEQEPEEQGISINLSSPRFSLRLPNTSVEVLSNLEIRSHSPSNVRLKTERNKEHSSCQTAQIVRKHVSSSTSIDADNSSSDISSLGEIKLKLKRRLRKNINSLSSDSSTSSKLSVDLNSISILPLRSEGEVNLPQRVTSRNISSMPSKSDGELSLGHLDHQ